jgi:hypothetical protein
MKSYFTLEPTLSNLGFKPAVWSLLVGLLSRCR